MKSIKYFPWTEVAIFIIATILTFVIADNLNLSIWLSILLTIAGYFIFLGRANQITVSENKIEIIFFNLIDGRVSIDLKRILKISSSESYEMETALDLESTYFLFSRDYNLDFLDNNERKRSLTFKINNRKKEIEIVNKINNGQGTKSS